jgi:hypothetical protein
MQIASLAVLFIMFLAVPIIVKTMGGILDTLPMRFASIILILAVLPYDRFIALGLFLVIAAIYIQHHHNDVILVLGPSSDNTSRDIPMAINSIQDADSMKVLHHGGHADETTDIMDYMPKGATQDNAFSRAGSSVDEKQVLTTEQLGSKAQSLFANDSEHANSLQRGNSNGRYED